MSGDLQQILVQAKKRQEEEMLQILEKQNNDLIAFAEQSQITIKNAIQELYNPLDLTAPVQSLDRVLQERLQALKENLNHSLQSLSDISKQWVENQVQPSKTNELLQAKIAQIMGQLEQDIIQTLSNHQARTQQQIKQAMNAQFTDFSGALQQIAHSHNSIQQDILRIKHQSEALKSQVEKAYRLMVLSSTMQSWVLKYPEQAAILLMFLTFTTLIFLILFVVMMIFL